jgi:LysM repeat protein
MRKYPYSREVLPFKEYFDKFKELKEGRKSFRFIVVRATSSGIPTWDTDLLVALEDFQMSESADEGDDVLIDFKLKQYKEYGIKILPESSDSTTTSTSEQPRPTEGKGETSSVYVVQSGDCLWNIAKAAYGNGARYTEIYQANKEAIEADARKHGKASSENGHWIWAGLKLTIPGIDTASSLKVTKL